jgi:hypothetical protein
MASRMHPRTAGDTPGRQSAVRRRSDDESDESDSSDDDSESGSKIRDEAWHKQHQVRSTAHAQFVRDDDVASDRRRDRFR